MLKNKLFNTLIPIVFLFTVILITPGCTGSGNDVVGSVAENFSLSIFTPSGLTKNTADVIKFTSVKLLIRDLKFEKENTEGTGSEVKIGPFVINLNLTGTINTVVVVNIPNGTYDEIAFKIHKVGGSETPPDPEFKEGDNNDQRYSVIVKGTFNGNTFVYKSKKSAQQKIKLKSPITIDGSKTFNVTLIVDPSKWFDDNGTILDPRDQSNESKIDNLIKDNIKQVFRDDNKDGKSDD
ncbi:MAG: hypothetical protein IH949_11565 [Bacteroidetes bacterium]|nr:hypothetical protein [Bacteroidota bacterium]